jgi:hypothetical protein
MATQILEAVGATRQRDTALAVLNAVNEGDYDEYLQELQGSEIDNYLNEQNDALLKTLSASLNSMTESLKSFAMTLSNSGLLQGVDLMVDGLGGFLNALSKIPEPLMNVISNMLMLKGVTAITRYIGELTGTTQRYQVLLNQGTKEEISNANAMSASANAYIARMDVLANTGQLEEAHILRLSNQKQGVLLLTDAYNKGQISASEFSVAIQNLITSEELNSGATNATVNAYLNKNAVVAKANGLTDQEQAKYQQLILQKRASKTATIQEKTAEEGFIASKLKNVAVTERATLAKGLEKLSNIATAASVRGATVAEEANTLAKTQGVFASIQYAIQNGILGTSFSVLGASVGVATAALSSLMSVITPIMLVVSLLSVGWNLLSGLFKDSGDSAKSASEKMEELNKELDEVNKKIKELNSLRGSTTDDTYYDKELKFWKERKQLIEKNIKLQKELNAYEMLFKNDKKSSR